MISPEKHQWNWKPKTKSKEDLTLDKELEKIRKKLNVRKNELTRMALSQFSIVNEIKSYHPKGIVLKSNQEVK